MFGSSVPGRLPLIGEQFGQAALGMITDAGEDVAQVGEGVDRHSLAGGDQTVQNRRRATAIVATQEGPISPTYRNSAQTPLGAVIVDFQIAVLAVAAGWRRASPALRFWCDEMT